MNYVVFLNQFKRDIPLHIQDRDKENCVVFREKLYQELKPRLHKAVHFAINGDWNLAHRYNSNISTDGNPEKIDPSNLLILIGTISRNHHYLFGRDLVFHANRVRIIRNFCYGHIPELKITDELIRDLSLNSPRVLSFPSLIAEVNQLLSLL